MWAKSCIHQAGKSAIIRSMDQSEHELERALRTAKRSVEVANAVVLLDDPHKHIAAAIHQFTFVLGRLVNERSQTR